MSQLQHNASPLLPLGHTVEGNKLVALDGFNFERHKHIIGISGSGKSSFLAAIVVFLLRQGISFCLIDPHGDLAKLILTLLYGSDFYSNPRAYDRLWYVDLNRQDGAIAWNFLKQDHIDKYKVASNLVEAIHRAWPSSSATTALDNTIEYSAFVLAECGVPLTHLQRFLLERRYRDSLLAKIKDQQITQFFDFKFSDKVSAQLIDSTMKRLDLLTFSPGLRAALGQRDNKINFRYLMDNHISCILNLGGLSDAEKRLAGCLMTVGLEQAFLSRATMPVEKRTPYHVIIDEFPLFSSSSETSFSNILEQVRKYSGTLYLAHQTISQLSKGMAGSLQNAISILFKLGYEDSSWAAGRFVRKQDELDTSLIDWVLGKSQESSPFDETKNTQEAKQIFESLARQEAIITLNNQPLRIRTLTIPSVKVDTRKLKEIEDTYARRLLTPLSVIEKISQPVPVPLVSLSTPFATRRKPVTPSITPLQTFVGAAGTDAELQAIFSLYGGYLTVSQLAKILGKSENTARNKLNKMVAAGILEQQSLPRTTPSGKTPTVFSLKKGTRKHEFLEHRLATAEILVNTALLPTVADFTIVELQSDDNLKASPLQLPHGNLLIPDGVAHLCSQHYEYTVYFEIDRNTELLKEKITAKLKNYILLASQCACMVVAFCVVAGGDLRVKTLKNWANDVVPEPLKEIFLFASLDLATLTPEMLFLSPLWSSIGLTPLQPLLER